MSAAAAAGGGGDRTPSINAMDMQFIREVEDLRESDLSDRPAIFVKIERVAQVLQNEPNDQSQRLARSLRDWNINNDFPNVSLKNICLEIQYLKMPELLQGLSCLLCNESELRYRGFLLTLPEFKAQGLLTPPFPEDQMQQFHDRFVEYYRKQMRELTDQIKKEYQGDIFKLPVYSMKLDKYMLLIDCIGEELSAIDQELLNNSKPLYSELIAVVEKFLPNCEKSTAQFFGRHLLCSAWLNESPDQQRKIFRICIDRGADFTLIDETYNKKPIILNVLEHYIGLAIEIRALNPHYFEQHKWEDFYDRLEDIFASGIVVPVFSDELLKLSDSLEMIFPGFRDCLVDYGANVNKFLTNNPEYSNKSQLLQRAQKGIYKTALNSVPPDPVPPDKDISQWKNQRKAKIGESSRVPNPIVDLISDYDMTQPNPNSYYYPKLRLIGLECQRLRALERGELQESEKKEEALHGHDRNTEKAADGIGGGGSSGGGGGAGSDPAIDRPAPRPTPAARPGPRAAAAAASAAAAAAPDDENFNWNEKRKTSKEDSPQGLD